MNNLIPQVSPMNWYMLIVMFFLFYFIMFMNKKNFMLTNLNKINMITMFKNKWTW